MILLYSIVFTSICVGFLPSKFYSTVQWPAMDFQSQVDRSFLKSMVIFLKAFDPSRQDKPCILSMIEYGWEDEDLWFRPELTSIALTTDTTDNFGKILHRGWHCMNWCKPHYLRRWTNCLEVKTVFSESCSQTWTSKIKDGFEEISRTWPIFVQLCCPWAGDSDLFLFFADPAELSDSPGTPSGSMLPSKGRMKSCILYMYMVSCMYDHNLCSYRICVFGTTCYFFVHVLSFSHVCSYWWVVESRFTLAVFKANSFKKRLLNSMIRCPSFSTTLLPNLG